jgi:diguanylate cyclase (GGDEF)-like protein
MQIDPATILLSGVFAKLLLAGLFLIFWLHDRRSVWFAWWSGAYCMGILATAVFLLQGVQGSFASIGLGGTAIIVTYAFCWQAARSFHERRPLWSPPLAAIAAWLGACAMPGFLDNPYWRVALSSLLFAAFNGLAAYEFWRGRHEQLLSRWPLIAVFSSLAVFFLGRLVVLDLLPFPLGARPVAAEAVAAFNMVLFLHTLVATVLVVAVTKERLELQQRRNAQTDPLTGALNRRALLARADRMLARHEYAGTPLCLLFLDLDHFKALNDRFGHSAGDDLLTRFVAVVQDCIRPSDFLFRLGGEEFCCLLPETHSPQARLIAERIRHQVETARLDVAGVPAALTVSIGIASTESYGYDLDRLMRRADAAVYAAKRRGRNQVAAGELETVPGGRVVPLRA